MAAWIFWLCAVGAIYSYALYPLLLQVCVPRRKPRRESAAGEPRPTATLIIACRNEARRLAHKLDNALQLRYPLAEILVASDASDDDSEEIAAAYADRGVRVVRSAQRRGKEYAQSLAIAEASGGIVVFSDAGTELPADSIDVIVERFRDPAIGAISSEDLFVAPDGKLVGEGAYVRYEMWLRRLESERAGLVGLSGSFFAVRREVLAGWNSSIPSDFACALMTVRAGMVAVSDAGVRGIYTDIKDPGKEYRRKVRTAVRGMTGLAHLAGVLNPFRHGVFAFQVWSHKLMRWLVPWFLLGLLVSSFLLAGTHTSYRWALTLQLVAYTIVLLAHFLGGLRRIGVVRIGYYFIQANIALGHAAVLFLMGRRIVVWEPSVR